jgi:hypothetical protein
MDATAFEALVLMLSHDDAEIQRLAADALGDHPPREKDARDRLVQAIQYHLFAPKPGVPRSMFLAHGKLAGKLETSEWAFEAASVTIRKDMGPQIFDAHVRALEMTKDAARDLMLGNLDVAVNFADADAKERQRMKEFVTATAEAMRTRELAVFLDALFRGEEDLAAKLEPTFQARLIATYRNVQVEPPIRADAVAEWLEKHPGRPFEVELAALETLSLVGTTKPEATIKLAQRLLAKPEQAKEIGRRLIAGQVGPGLQSEIVAALKKHGEGDLTGEFAALFKAIEKDLPSLSP